jgi:hypothetical protein
MKTERREPEAMNMLDYDSRYTELQVLHSSIYAKVSRNTCLNLLSEYEYDKDVTWTNARIVRQKTAGEEIMPHIAVG